MKLDKEQLILAGACVLFILAGLVVIYGVENHNSLFAIIGYVAGGVGLHKMLSK